MNETVNTEPTTSNPPTDEPKAHFAKAIEEAKVGAQMIGKQAQERADAYRDKFTQARSDLGNEAKVRSGEARERALQVAQESKTRACGALASLGKLVEDNASYVDEKVGVAYGDYMRTAARSMNEAADRIESKEIAELAEDAREFVRTRPELAVGLATLSGFMLARVFKKSDK